MSEARPLFVVLDGIDGCGKTTQARLLARALSERRGRAAVHVREPGSTKLGERIRALLLSRELQIAPASETLLFAAARRALLDETIAPALSSGVDVVCERFHASTFAYQSVAGGLAEGEVLDLLRTWAGAPAPDLTLILDLEPAAALARRTEPGDRIEDRGLAFQEAVARGYRRYPALDARAQLVAAGDAAESVHQRVLSRVEVLFAEARSRG